MAMSIRLSDQIIHSAKITAQAMHRSSAGQIEHWAQIGKIAEENPELTYEFIQRILIAKAELDNGMVSDYEFDD